MEHPKDVEHPKEIAARLGLEAMRRLDVREVRDVSGLLSQLAQTAFTGRALGGAVDVAEAMIRERAWVVMTLSGAMTMAGLSRLIIDMIERGWIQCLVATGALVGHGMTEDIGLEHYKADPSISDEHYCAERLNRVYDVIEPEYNLNRLEEQVRKLLHELADHHEEPIGTCQLLQYLGEHLGGEGVLQAAAKAGVPVYIPAFSDAELGLDFAIHAELRRSQGRRGLRYDPFVDLNDYAGRCCRELESGRKLGIFTIGGGVPRNWAQQVGPYMDITNTRLGYNKTVPRFNYGVRICPDPVHYGHLSGCTYSEGVSWGKFVSPKEGGRYAEVLLDATVGWPLVVRALMDRGL